MIHRVKAGQGYEYELLWDGEGEAGERFVMGLSAPDAHVYDARRSGAAGQAAFNRSGFNAAGKYKERPF